MTMANNPIGTSPLIAPVISAQSKRRSPLPVLALLALNGLAGIGVWQALERPVDTTPIKGPGQTAAPPRLTSADPGGLIPIPRSVADLPETARRPLFSASRRPWVEKPKPEVAAVKVVAPPPVVVPPYPANQLRLIGVIQSNSTAVSAVIRVGSDSEGTLVRVGESIRGWKLREVNSDSAIIETRGERVELITESALPVGPNSQPQLPRR
jgi:Type II secretion system protein C